MDKKEQCQALWAKLEECGFTPAPAQITTEGNCRIDISTVPLPPARKLQKLDLHFWLELYEEQGRVCVRLGHEDVGRMLYYLGKAVGTSDAIDYLKQHKKRLMEQLYSLGITKEAPPEDWYYVIL